MKAGQPWGYHRVVLFCLLLTGSQLLAAAPLNVDSALLSGGVRTLRTDWQYHAGEPAPSRLTAWEDIGAPGWDKAGTPRQGWPGRGYLRLPLEISPEAMAVPFAVMLEHLGASEIFLDGQLLRRFGEIRPQGYLGHNPNRTPVPLVFTSPGRHELLIHYAGPDSNSRNRWALSWFESDRRSPSALQPFGVTVRLSTLEVANETLRTHTNQFTLSIGIILGVLGACALLLLTLFWFDPHDRSFLYGGLLAVIMEVSCIVTCTVYFGHLGLNGLLTTRVSASLCRALFEVCFLLFVSTVCRQPLARSMWLIVLSVALAVHALRFIPAAHFIYEPSLMAVEVLCGLWAGSSMWVAWRRHERNIQPLAIAVLCGTVLLVLNSFPSAVRNVIPPAMPMNALSTALLFAFLVLPGIYLLRRMGSYASELRVLNETLEAKVEQRTGQLAESERRAQAASEAKTRFLTSMSHEIRTPMNGVMGLSELLLHDGLTPEQHSSIAMIHTSASGLLTIINEILDLSKVEAGQVELQHESFSLRQCLRESLDVIAAEARRKGLTLDSEVAEDVPDGFVGDRVRLRQVLINLLGNAVKFTNAGSVRVIVQPVCQPRLNEAGLAFRIEDTGVGLSEAALAHLFQAFYQDGSVAAARDGGTGLGLAISKRYVDLMGGRIYAENRAEAGARFVVELILPLAEAATGAEPAGVSAVPLDLEPVSLSRVLVADDNAINRIVITRLVQKLGPVVDFAEDGAQVLERLAAERYDLILMDVHMPIVDGLEATRRIIAGQGTTRPRIIGLTASAFPEDQRACLAAGMDGFLSKPVSLAQLRGAFAELSTDNGERAGGETHRPARSQSTHS